MRIILICLFFLTLSACSKINSVAPFDDQQASIVAKAMSGKNCK